MTFKIGETYPTKDPNMQAVVLGQITKRNGITYYAGVLKGSNEFLIPVLWNRRGSVTEPYASGVDCERHALLIDLPGKLLWQKISLPSEREAAKHLIKAGKLMPSDAITQALYDLLPFTIDGDSAKLAQLREYVLKENPEP